MNTSASPQGLAPASPASPSTARLRRGLAWFSVVLLIAMWGGVLAIVQHRLEEALDDSAGVNRNLASAVNEQSLRVISAIDQALLRVQSDARLRPANDIPLERYANETGLMPKILTQISVIDGQGRFQGSNLDPGGAKTGHVDLSEREHVRIHLWPDQVDEGMRRSVTQGLFIGKPVLGKVSKKWTIQLSRALLDDQGRTVGVVVASLNPDYFEQSFASIDLGEGGIVALIGSDLTIRTRVSNGRPDGMGKHLNDSSPLLTQSLRSPTGSYRSVSPIDGTSRTIAFHRVGNYPLLVLVGSAHETTLQPWRRMRAVVFALAAAFSVAVLGGLAYTRRSIQQLEESHLALSASEAKAQAANQAKSEFLTAMSHELRTPLTSIRGFAELMEYRIQDPIFKTQAGTIRKAAEYLNSLLTDILDLAKVESGKMRLLFARENLPPLFRGAVDFYAVSAQQKGLALSLDWDPDCPDAMFVDALRLKQVLNNLISNAIKFTEQGQVRVHVHRMGSSLLCDVEDTGPGILEDKLELIFERFRQADDKVSFQHGGTGLGLTLSRALTEMMGGQLTVTSEVGKGSTFTVALPICMSEDDLLPEWRSPMA